MPIDTTPSDTARGIQHEPNRDYPQSVTIQLTWMVDGVARYRTMDISSDRFFGFGLFGAPIEGAALIGMIENARREGPFIPEPRKHVKSKR